MYEYKHTVEQTANSILNAIRERPSSTTKELQHILEKDKGFRKLKKTTFLSYLAILHKNGYIKHTYPYPYKYTLIKDTPFSYVRVSKIIIKKRTEVQNHDIT